MEDSIPDFEGPGPYQQHVFTLRYGDDPAKLLMRKLLDAGNLVSAERFQDVIVVRWS